MKYLILIALVLFLALSGCVSKPEEFQSAGLFEPTQTYRDQSAGSNYIFLIYENETAGRYAQKLNNVTYFGRFTISGQLYEETYTLIPRNGTAFTLKSADLHRELVGETTWVLTTY